MKKDIPELKPESKQRMSMTLFFTIIIFAILLVTLLSVSAIISALINADILKMFHGNTASFGTLIAFLLITSILIGAIVTLVINKLTLKPYGTLIQQIDRLADGDYTARIEFGKFLSNQPGVKCLVESFNKMAEELQGTEMLRRDFINNFSHEFKTPIVSISGFAKLLRHGNLSNKQKEEYLAIIEEESLRLSNMATILLNLSKIENHTILTDITHFNLSEQIRRAILLLEDKWVKKKLDLHIDFDEYYIDANEELLKQIWINLLDNAIKFSPDYGTIKVEISENNNSICVSISNNGEPIPEKTKDKIFNKFYQTDESHSSEGNGIGLAVVKEVVSLHNGSIMVDSNENLTVFKVILPKG